jgi:HSP20 family protein
MTNVQRQQREARDAWFWPESEASRQVRSRPARRGTRVFPSIIVSATEDRLIVRAEMPGIDLEQLDISVAGDVLSIQGVRLTGENLEGGWYHRRERESGGFNRAVRLPAEVDGDKTEASYQAGVLTVTVPLRQEARPRQVPIKVVEG